MADRDLFRHPFVFLATGCCSGLSPVAPGTAGCLVGVALYGCLSFMPFLLYLITCIAFVFLSVWIADRAALMLQDADPPSIVIDEIAGYLVTMIGVPASWRNVLIGFVLFRIFDIVKPFPVRRIESMIPGGWGIVLDDVAAGVYGCLAFQVLMRWM